MIQSRRFACLTVVFLLGLLFAQGSTVSAAGKKAEKPSQSGPKTVVDYFLLIPDTWLAIPADERKVVLAASGTVNDVKNGFLSFTYGDSDSYTFTVFRKPTGGYLSALCFKGQILSKTGAVKDTCQVTFLDFDKGAWNDVTAKVLPTADQSDLVYELPQVGTTIKVKKAGSDESFELLWKDGAFKKK